MKSKPPLRRLQCHQFFELLSFTIQKCVCSFSAKELILQFLPLSPYSGCQDMTYEEANNFLLLLYFLQSIFLLLHGFQCFEHYN